MLYILYGTLDDINYKSVDYFADKGIDKVEKYNYSESENPQLVSSKRPRKYVSKDEFYQKTDSLFRYVTGGINVGFNYEQISDAVCDKCDKLLSLSTGDIDFLAEIKRVYGDSVCLIYAYIDDATLRKIINQKVWENYAGDNTLSDEERKSKMRNERKRRADIAKSVKRAYLKYRGIFDNVVMYGGEKSAFDMEHLLGQYECIISEQKYEEAVVEYGDVFVFCSQDKQYYDQIRSELREKVISVFDNGQLDNADSADRTRDAIRNAEIVVAVISRDTVQDDFAINEFMLMLDEAQRSGARVVPVVMEGVTLNDFPLVLDKLNPWDVEIRYNEEFAGLGERISFLLRFEKDLRVYSGQVENYLGLEMYEAARECQKKHLALCENAYEGPYVKIDEFIMLTSSKLKYAEILIKLQDYEGATELLEEHIDECNQVCESVYIKPHELATLSSYRLKYAEFFIKREEYENVYNLCGAIICDMENAFGETYSYSGDSLYLDALEMFVRSCAVLARDEENMVFRVEDVTDSEDWKEKSDEYKNSPFGQHLKWREEYARELYRRFTDEDYTYSVCEEKEVTSFVRAVGVEQSDIAKHGELAFELFERLIHADAKGMSKFDLVEGYERVLDYCRHIGLKGKIPDECIRRIGDLNMYDASKDNEDAVADESLKIYLGQKKSSVGEYDVFLSFKSEDEALAQKVYKYLMQSGKVTFFSRATLPQIGNSKYEAAIFEAIDKSKHMIVVSTNSDYLKTEWVKKEWSRFISNSKKASENGEIKNLLLILDDRIVANKDERPDELKEGIEIIRTSEFRSRLLGYLR